MSIKKFFVRSILFVLPLFLCLAMCSTSAFAKKKKRRSGKKLNIKGQAIKVSKVTGTIKITSPDGTVLTVKKGDKMPEVPAGSKVEVVSGSANVAVGSMKMTLETSQAIVLTQDPLTQKMELVVPKESVGTIQVKVGKTTVSLDKNNVVSVDVNETTNKVEVVSVKGEIKIETPKGDFTVGEGTTLDSAVQAQEVKKEVAPEVTKKPEPKKPEVISEPDAEVDVEAELDEIPEPEPVEEIVEDASPVLP